MLPRGFASSAGGFFEGADSCVRPFGWVAQRSCPADGARCVWLNSQRTRRNVPIGGWLALTRTGRREARARAAPRRSARPPTPRRATERAAPELRAQDATQAAQNPGSPSILGAPEAHESDRRGARTAERGEDRADATMSSQRSDATSEPLEDDALSSVEDRFAAPGADERAGLDDDDADDDESDPGSAGSLQKFLAGRRRVVDVARSATPDPPPAEAPPPPRASTTEFVEAPPVGRTVDMCDSLWPDARPATVYFAYPPRDVKLTRGGAPPRTEALGTRRLNYRCTWERNCVKNAFSLAGFRRVRDGTELSALSGGRVKGEAPAVSSGPMEFVSGLLGLGKDSARGKGDKGDKKRKKGEPEESPDAHVAKLPWCASWTKHPGPELYRPGVKRLTGGRDADGPWTSPRRRRGDDVDGPQRRRRAAGTRRSSGTSASTTSPGRGASAARTDCYDASRARGSAAPRLPRRTRLCPRVSYCPRSLKRSRARPSSTKTRGRRVGRREATRRAIAAPPRT